MTLMPDLIGWAASAVLMATLGRQAWRQWKDPDPDGVSHWLFLGQITASVGFVAYSWLLDNLVFIVTNSLLLMTGLFGQYTYLRAKRKAARKGSTR